MSPREIVMPVVMACGLIALGLIPGLLWSLKEGIQRFSDALSSLSTNTPPRRFYPQPAERLPGQGWLAAGGFLIILLALIAYLTH